MTNSFGKLLKSIIVATGPITSLLISVPAQAQVFTAVAPACAIDSASTAKYETSAGRLRFSGNNIGEIVARCNVTNPMDLGGNPGFTVLEAVFRDTDARAADTRVQVKLWRVSNSTGGVFQIGDTLDSNVHGNLAVTPGSQMHHIAIPGQFDFYRYAYFIEIRIKRTNASQGPDVSLVRLRL
jgi:hypothetical protein